METQKVQESQVFGLVLGKVIATLRERRQLTQIQLAQAVGISQPVLSRIESGKMQPDAFQLREIAHALGVELHELHAQVQEAMEATKRAAEATRKKPNANSTWDELMAVAGVVGLMGLVIFAVAVVLEGGSKPAPSPKPAPNPKKQ
ncbi:helix-turn-helix transcriptional regulator [Archangium sp.]|uniref:helix-turn-helix domain-containing protein n=1 Tax=Archangium sp. TaxID=1872627 RepID=UPI002D3C1641|nr:helix-turn-helix transcriptional regulator [Archangium sp.]HYO58076.1 helix-turn-helix transcriptional regulator [Archangium sp.]